MSESNLFSFDVGTISNFEHDDFGKIFIACMRCLVEKKVTTDKTVSIYINFNNEGNINYCHELRYHVGGFYHSLRSYNTYCEKGTQRPKNMNDIRQIDIVLNMRDNIFSSTKDNLLSLYGDKKSTSDIDLSPLLNEIKEIKKEIAKMKSTSSSITGLEEVKSLAVELKNISAELENIKNKPSVVANAMICNICLVNGPNTVFDCGHMCCSDCAKKITKCQTCRAGIKNKIKLFFD